MVEETSTPPFVLWALAHPCELRTQINKWDQCEPTERLLRPLREISLAQHEQRVINGFALHRELTPGGDLSQPPLGFSINEVLAGFGGESYVTDLCKTCSANVAENSKGVAGCYGMIFDWGSDEIDVVFDRITDKLSLTSAVANEFQQTSPSYYGVWMESPLTNRQLELLGVVFERLLADNSSTQIEAFCRAIQVAMRDRLALHCIHFPPGVVSGRRWKLSPHCAACKAERELQSKRCNVCGKAGATEDLKSRNARGVRPFMNLADMIGREATRSLVRDYLVSQGASEEEVEAFFLRNKRWF